jgi:ABC-2 type transport system permease protein
MSQTLSHSWRMTQRHLLTLWRQPWYVAVTLSQPIIWLVLFGGLFRRVVEIPGFAAAGAAGSGGEAPSYLVFLVPGIIVMSSLFSNGWSGMGIIDDLDRGVMDRFLVSPVHRSALLTGRLVMQGVTALIQSVIIIGVAYLMGARFEGGVGGVAVLLGLAVVLGVSIASLSHALALTIRREESVIAASQFVVLPATFVSSAFMARDLAPEWIQKVAAANPVNWATEAGRWATAADPDWAAIGVRGAGLVALALAASALATRAFRSYQASV